MKFGKISVFLTLAFVLLGTGCGKGINVTEGSGRIPGLTNAFGAYKDTVSLIEKRMLQVQNTDGGWDFMDTPANLEASTTSPTTATNMWGVNALGVYDAYTLTGDIAALAAAHKTALHQMALPLSRTQRLFAPDCELLIKLGTMISDAAMAARGRQGQVYEKEFFAALHILGTTSPTDAQVNALTQAQVDAVSSANMVAAARSRASSGGRNASVRAYDWSMKIRVAILRGDTDYQRALMDVAAADLADIVAAPTPSLLGLAATISDLASINEPTYSDAKLQARALLLPRQAADGSFPGATPQDHAFIAQALYDTGDAEPLAKLLAYLKSQLSPQGYLLDSAGREIPEAQSELLSALVRIVKI